MTPWEWSSPLRPLSLRPSCYALVRKMFGRLGAGPRLRELPARLEQVLGEHLHVGQHRHEVGVAGPARNDVQVDVADDARARDAAEVPPGVVALRRIRLRQRADPLGREAVDLERLGVLERAEVTD